MKTKEDMRRYNGGARQGAGRKENNTKRCHVRLTSEHIKKALVLGSGNLSAGLRIWLDSKEKHEAPLL